MAPDFHRFRRRSGETETGRSSVVEPEVPGFTGSVIQVCIQIPISLGRRGRGKKFRERPYHSGLVSRHSDPTPFSYPPPEHLIGGVTCPFDSGSPLLGTGSRVLSEIENRRVRWVSVGKREQLPWGYTDPLSTGVGTEMSTPYTRSVLGCH